MGRSARTQDPSALSCGPSDSLRVPLRMPAAAVSYALLFQRNRALSAYGAATLTAGMTAMHTQMATAVLLHALRHRSGSATTKAAAIDKTPRTPRRDRPQGAIPTDSRTPMTKTVAQNAEDAPASLHPASSSRRVNMANVSDERRAGQALGVRSKGLLRNEPDRSSIVLEVVGLKGRGHDVRIAGHELRRARCDLEALRDACDAVPTQAHECARSRPPRCASGQLTSREHANESLQRLDDRDPKSPCLKGSFP